MTMPVPYGLEYLPFQKEGIAFSLGYKSVLFGDEMGLGKTVQALGWINCHPEVEDVLVVCPASLRINWRREIYRWLVSPAVECLVISYDALKKLDYGQMWDLVILDEAHYIKNKKAQRSRYCRQLYTRKRMALTGTPLLNRPIELWHLLHWLCPKDWPLSSYQHFGIRYCAGHRKRFGARLIWDFQGASHLGELNKLLQDVMIRRLKSEVLPELPPKRRQVIELPWNRLHADLRAALARAKARVEEIKDTYKEDVRKLDCEMEVAFHETAELRHDTGKAKVSSAVRFLSDVAEEHKVVVFAHHRDVINDLAKGLEGHYPVVLHGGTTERCRQQAVDIFQTDPTCRVFIGQVQAAGVGLTLTAASHVVFVEPDWQPGMISQAEDRCHRVGQHESVLVQHLVLENSFDAVMSKTLVKKQEVLDHTLIRKEEEEW